MKKIRLIIISASIFLLCSCTVNYNQLKTGNIDTKVPKSPQFKKEEKIALIIPFEIQPLISFKDILNLENFFTIKDDRDLALYAHTQDLRSDLEQNQNISLYTVLAFSKDFTASAFLMDAARNGGFIDKNGNNIPDGDYADPPEMRKEWDENNDGKPDH